MRSMRWWTRLFGGSGSGDAPATAQERRDEQLSAYLDGELAPADAAALERALAVDAGLHAEL
ncbi:MAG: zf-HC2 domain-containing protein, partial [Chloroflexi bacterium]|nr:zf-HC2 domain-containing protein [Chloroflexota bacterium]